MTKPLLTNRAAVVALIVLLSIPAPAVSPSTPQLPDPGNPGMSKQDQEKLGLKAMAEVYKEMPVLPDSSPVTQYVQRLGAKLVKQIPQQYSWPYQFHVIQQKDINAFALPGGPLSLTWERSMPRRTKRNSRASSRMRCRTSICSIRPSRFGRTRFRIFW